MVRGRKPKSPEHHERSGDYAKDPQRRKADLAKPSNERPVKSDEVKADPVASKKWDELHYTLEQMGTLSASYSSMMESYAMCYSLYYKSLARVNQYGILTTNSQGNLMRNPALIELHKSLDSIMKLQIEMGLTPASRSRVSIVEQDKEVDPVLDLLRKRSAGKN